MRAAGHVLRRDDGSPIACYGLVMDIHEQKKAAARIEETMNQAKLANAAKSSVLARMSHDIRTLLNGILGLIEINDKQADDVVLQAENWKKARIAANHLLSLINDVLQLRELKIGVFRIEDINESTGKIILTVSEDADCSGLPVLGETVCNYDEGFIAGILSTYSGKNYEAIEVDCWATGDRVCRFWAEIAQ